MNIRETEAAMAEYMKAEAQRLADAFPGTKACQVSVEAYRYAHLDEPCFRVRTYVAKEEGAWSSDFHSVEEAMADRLKPTNLEQQRAKLLEAAKRAEEDAAYFREKAAKLQGGTNP